MVPFPFIIFDEEKPLLTHFTQEAASNGSYYRIYYYFLSMTESEGTINFKEDRYGFTYYDWVDAPTYTESALGFNVSGTTYSYMAFS